MLQAIGDDELQKYYRNTLKPFYGALKSKDGVLVVEQVEGGYELPNGEIVNDLAPLHKRYAVIIVDDVEYRLAHPEEWTEFERFCQEENRRLNPQMYQ